MGRWSMDPRAISRCLGTCTFLRDTGSGLGTSVQMTTTELHDSSSKSGWCLSDGALPEDNDDDCKLRCDRSRRLSDAQRSGDVRGCGRSCRIPGEGEWLLE